MVFLQSGKLSYIIAGHIDTHLPNVAIRALSYVDLKQEHTQNRLYTCTVRYGTVRYGTVRYGSIDL